MLISELHKIEHDRIFEIFDILKKSCPVCKYQNANDASCANSAVACKNECSQALQRRCNIFSKAKQGFLHALLDIEVLIVNDEKQTAITANAIIDRLRL